MLETHHRIPRRSEYDGGVARLRVRPVARDVPPLVVVQSNICSP